MNASISKRIITLIGLLCLLVIAPSAYAQSGHYLIHTATAANTVNNWTSIDDPYTNGNPNALLMVTQNWSGYRVYNNHNIGVWYNAVQGRWTIFNQDRTAMPRNATFNVYVSAPFNGAFTHIAALGNISNHTTIIDNPVTNENPELKLFVTPKYNPNNVYHNHPIGVWYDSAIQKWVIFNEDQAGMSVRAAFNVFVLEEGGWGAEWPDGFELVSIYTHVATAANSAWNYTRLNTPALGQAGVWVFTTPSYNPNFVYNNHSIGVWYTGQVWSIFNQDIAAIPTDAAFNVWIRSFRPRPIRP